MTKFNFTPYFFVAGLLLIVGACSPEFEQENSVNATTNIQTTSQDSNLDDGIERLGGGGCLNVVIIDGYAYAACDNIMRVASLETGEQNTISVAADDIAADEARGLLFTQAGSTIRMLTVLNDPMAPEVVATTTANFSIFSGLDAANCVLAVSGGAGGSNTTVFNYSSTEINLVTDGIPAVDNQTGAPDVFVAPIEGGARAFYSEDIGAVANWGIQIVDFNGSSEVTNVGDLVVLTPGQFPGPFGSPFGPANFPVESEFLNNRLYVANFAAQGIEVIDLENNNAITQISLPYEPINIGTDGEFLFVVGLTNSEVDIIDPSSATVSGSLGSGLTQPTGVAANSTHVVVADRSMGLILFERE